MDTQYFGQAASKKEQDLPIPATFDVSNPKEEPFQLIQTRKESPVAEMSFDNGAGESPPYEEAWLDTFWIEQVTA